MIAFASRTGNIRHIVNQLNIPNQEINEDIEIVEPYILFTYTDGLGQVPAKVEKFMQSNHSYCKGVIVSGNSNFGHNLFGRAGDILSSTYEVPLLHKLDLRGSIKDYEVIIKKIYEVMK